MIKNKRQYQNTRKQIEHFRDALALFDTTTCPAGVDPLMHQAYHDGLQSQLETLEIEASEFEALSRGGIEVIELNSLDELPLGLIKARIARGFTHKDLAGRLDVSPQQIQRWEYEEYANVGFRRLTEIADALDLEIEPRLFIGRKNSPSVASRFRAQRLGSLTEARKRELIEVTKGEKRYVRRDSQGRFKETDDAGPILTQDVRREAKTVRPRQGDPGDKKRK